MELKAIFLKRRRINGQKAYQKKKKKEKKRKQKVTRICGEIKTFAHCC